METEPEQASSHEMIVETKEIQEIDAMEEALESLVKRIEVFAQKEVESVEKFKKQESVIKDLTDENQTLKQENERLWLTINNYMKNFECFSGQKKESLQKGEIHSAIETEKRISELNTKIVDLEDEKADLETKNALLDEENQDLAKKIVVMTQDIKKLNTLITKNMEDFMNGERVEKSKRKYSRTKKENSAKQSRKESTDEKPRNSPIRTRKKPERKVYPSEQKTPSVNKLTETEYNDDDFDDEDDFEINISDASSGEEEEEFQTPKKGKRKAAVPTKKPAVSKKVKKNEIKESVAQSRNMIQYQLFA